MSLYSDKLRGFQNKINEEIGSYIPSPDRLTEKTAKAMSYACDAGGKRLRPVLFCLWMDSCGGNIEEAIPFACAIEMIHNYSLIHDDMPCMDNSDLRHGKPSVHKAFGDDIALLAGDGLLTLAFEIMLNSQNNMLPVNRRLEAAYTLAEAAGINGMVGGQNLDLDSEGKELDFDSLLLLQSGKTAALIKAACVMGAQCAGASESIVRAAAEYGENLGLCFQIVDDILDVVASEEQLGKPIHSDEENQKNTMVSLLGVEKAKDLAVQYTNQAIDAIKDLPFSTKEFIDLSKELITRIS